MNLHIVLLSTPPEISLNSVCLLHCSLWYRCRQPRFSLRRPISKFSFPQDMGIPDDVCQTNPRDIAHVNHTFTVTWKVDPGFSKSVTLVLWSATSDEHPTTLKLDLPNTGKYDWFVSPDLPTGKKRLGMGLGSLSTLNIGADRRSCQCDEGLYFV